MVYLVLAVLIVLTAILLLRLRVRFEISQHRRLLFVGLGRSGPEFDFANHVTHVKVLGMTVKSIPRVEKPAEDKARHKQQERKDDLIRAHKVEEAKLERADTGQPAPPTRTRELLDLLRHNSRALLQYVTSMWHAVIIEELEGQVRGGFSAPHLTGQAYGYYHALMGAVPALAGRFQFIPDWMGASFTGNMRVTVALPLYVLVYRTIVLMIHLPVRRILQFVKAKKKGVHDGAE